MEDGPISRDSRWRCARVDSADLETPAAQVVTLEPAAGTVVETTTDIAVNTNPAAADMPVVVPVFADAPGETFASYAARLHDLGLTATEQEAPDGIELGNVYDTDAAPGTRVRAGTDVKVQVASEPQLSAEQALEIEQQEACDLDDGGTNTDPRESAGAPQPGALPKAEWYDRAEPDQPVFKALVKPASGASGEIWRDVPLYVGWTRPSSDPLQRWDGWGWRKIKAKHGWTQADRDATQEALQHPPLPGNDKMTKLMYLGAEYPGKDNARCMRVVIVDTRRSSGEEKAGLGPREIVTSYGGNFSLVQLP